MNTGLGLKLYHAGSTHVRVVGLDEVSSPGATITSVPPRWLPLFAAAPAHTRSPPMASEVGAPPTFTLAVTWSRRGSIQDTVPEYWLATHTDPAPTARAAGPLQTGIRARTVSVPGSTRETVESRLSATHSDPAANASAAGPSPTRTRLVTLPVAGSIFSTAASSYPATQTAPSPIATASGCTSRDTVRPGDPVAGSTSNNRSADGSVTHSRPRPNPIAPRPDPGSGIVWVTLSVSGSILVTVAPTVLAIQIAPPPTATLPGSPPARI